MIDKITLEHIQLSLEKITGMIIPLEELKKIIPEIHTVIYNKGAFFVRTGEVSNVMTYVQKGLFRIYLVNKNGKEYTKNFCDEGQFMGAQTSLFTGAPSLTNIQAIENSVLLELDYNFLIQLTEQNFIWQKLLRLTTEQDYLQKEKRESELLLYDAKTRYIHFINEHPKWAGRIKQHYAASYLGMSPETLSRIKEQL